MEMRNNDKNDRYNDLKEELKDFINKNYIYYNFLNWELIFFK